jgi:hypothetical protein
MKDSQKKVLNKREILQNKTRGKTTNKMEGRCTERCLPVPRGTRMEETSWGQGRMEASFEGGQGPEGAVPSWMDGRTDGYHKSVSYRLLDRKT